LSFTVGTNVTSFATSLSVDPNRHSTFQHQHQQLPIIATPLTSTSTAWPGTRSDGDMLTENFEQGNTGDYMQITPWTEFQDGQHLPQ